MPKRTLVAVVFVAIAGLLVGEAAEAQSTVQINSVVVADQDGRTRPFHKANEQVFVLVVMENVTSQEQPFSLGCKVDGLEVCYWTGGINPASRHLLPSATRVVLPPGVHTVVATVCASSYPCGHSEDDDVLDEMTVQFRVYRPRTN
jgi:hypothetical protein